MVKEHRWGGERSEGGRRWWPSVTGSILLTGVPFPPSLLPVGAGG